MRKEFSSTKVKELNLNIEGNAFVEFTHSKNNSFFMGVDYNNDKFVFEFDNQNNKTNVRITNLETKKVIKDFLDNLSNFNNFNDILIFFSKINVVSEKLKILVELPDYLENFTFKLNNGLVKFSYLNSSDCEIKGNNVALKMVENISVNKCNIKINNSNLELVLNNKLTGMKIKLNKGNITFIREADAYNIGIDCKGNKVFSEGVLSGQNNIVFCKVNNGTIKVN